MLKRVLPFVLTLIVGTALGSLMNLFRPRVSNVKPVLIGRSYQNRGCSIHSRSRFGEWPDEVKEEKDESSFSAGREFNNETQVIFLSKPAPHYTAAARREGITGVVKLRAVFGADGRVRDIKSITTLPDGLTEESIRAAERIQFIPARINNEPISVERLVEYNFSLP